MKKIIAAFVFGLLCISFSCGNNRDVVEVESINTRQEQATAPEEKTDVESEGIERIDGNKMKAIDTERFKIKSVD